MNAIAERRNASWCDVPRVSTLLAVVLAGLWIAPALAQAPAWPGDKTGQQPKGAPAWPGEQPRTPGATQASVAPVPTMSAPPMSSPPGMMAPGSGMAPPNDKQQACAVEFARLREDVDKKGLIVKTTNERKGSREELCKALTNVSAAMGRWYKYVKANSSTCGIPADTAKQLSANNAQLVKLKTNVCNGGAQAAAGPRPPSLSEALGAVSAPTQENTTVRRGGTLDTLTGNPIR